MNRIFLLISILFLAACGGTASKSGKTANPASAAEDKVVEAAVIVPAFDAEIGRAHV